MLKLEQAKKGCIFLTKLDICNICDYCQSVCLSSLPCQRKRLYRVPHTVTIKNRPLNLRGTSFIPSFGRETRHYPFMCSVPYCQWLWSTRLEDYNPVVKKEQRNPYSLLVLSCCKQNKPCPKSDIALWSCSDLPFPSLAVPWNASA